MELPGFKYNMTDVQAALGIHQLRRLAGFHGRRAEIAAEYTRAFRDSDALEPPVERPHVRHAWHLYVLRIRPGVLRIDRDRVIQELLDRNIATSVHFIPVHLHSYYRHRYQLPPNRFPVALDNYRRMVSLPLHPGLTPRDVSDVIEAVMDVVRVYRR